MNKRRLSFEVSSRKLRFGPFYRVWQGKTASRLLLVGCLGVLTMAAVRLPRAPLSRLWESILGRSRCHNCTSPVSAKVAEIPAVAGTFANFDVTGAGTSALEGTGATSINATGDIAGIYITTGNVAHGFARTSGGTITPFDVTGAGGGNDQGTFAISIDADNNIAGMYADSSNVYHGFIRSSGGTVTPFNVPAAGTSGHRGTMPTSVNGGVITGIYVTGSSGTTSVYHGFIRQTSGTLTYPVDVPGGGSGDKQGTQPLSINASGDITGTYRDASSVDHGFIYAAGTFTYPIDPSGSVATFPTSIDAGGDITGIYLDSQGLMHGFVRTAAGTIASFDPPGASTIPPGSGKGIHLDGTIPASINTSGTIAGFYTDNNKVAHAFFRTSGGTITSPLDDSAAGTGAMEGTGATSINDSGMMAGAYLDSSSVLHGFVFTPNSQSPAITFTPASLNFGNQVVNVKSAAKTVTVKNTGTGTLNLNSVMPTADFTVSANACGSTLAPGKTCKVSVTFTPPQLGKATGNLQFSDNAPNSPQSVALLGTGVQPAAVTPPTATYAKQKVGTTSAAKTFTLANNQSTALSGIVISTTGDFAVSATTCTTSLAATKKCAISVTFTPTQTGTRTGQLKISDSASNSPQTAALKGVGD